MSVMRPNKLKVNLTRSGPDPVWQLIRDEYAGDDPVKLKQLAMLALREGAEWPLEWIGDVFSHHKGHVSRCLQKTCRELRKRFQLDPTWRTPAGKFQ